MRKLGIAFAAASIAAALAAPSSAEPLKIRVSWATAPSHITPLLPELPKDVYRHWGKSYVIEPVFIAGGGAMLTALAANEIEIAGQNYLSLASSIITAKLDTRVILGLFASKPPNADNAFWVKSNSGINKVTDLKGKITAVNGRGGGVDAALRKMMRDNAMEEPRDYTVVELRFPAMLPASSTGASTSPSSPRRSTSRRRRTPGTSSSSPCATRSGPTRRSFGGPRPSSSRRTAPRWST